MNGKSVGLKILWWSEMVIALRVLLFTVPVVINKKINGNFSLLDVDDRFIVLITLTAILYFAIAFSSIAGYRFWKVLHYSGSFLVLLGSIGLIKMLGYWPAPVGAHYFIPFYFSIGGATLAGILGRSK